MLHHLPQLVLTAAPLILARMVALRQVLVLQAAQCNHLDPQERTHHLVLQDRHLEARDHRLTLLARHLAAPVHLLAAQAHLLALAK